MAIPAVLVMDTLPVVENPLMVCEIVPAKVIPPAPDVNVPLLVKLPCSVSKFEPGLNVAPLLMVKGTLVLLPI